LADVDLALGVQVEVTTGTTDLVRRCNFPANARTFRVQFRTNPGKMVLVSALADGAALSTTDYESIAANTLMEFDVPGVVGRARNLVTASRHAEFTSATGSTVFEIVALP